MSYLLCILIPLNIFCFNGIQQIWFWCKIHLLTTLFELWYWIIDFNGNCFNPHYVILNVLFVCVFLIKIININWTQICCTDCHSSGGILFLCPKNLSCFKILHKALLLPINKCLSLPLFDKITILYCQLNWSFYYRKYFSGLNVTDLS